jgi:molecular chaperone DnaJ
LVKQHHPDAGGDDQRMLALNAAWEVLGDQDRRRKFDRTRISPPAASRQPDLRRARSAHNRAVAAMMPWWNGCVGCMPRLIACWER